MLRALQVVGDGGEMDLDGGFGETSPSHSAHAITSLESHLSTPDKAAFREAQRHSRSSPFIHDREGKSKVAICGTDKSSSLHAQAGPIT